MMGWSLGGDEAGAPSSTLEDREALDVRADGERMQVIRPDSPALALAVAKVALDHNDAALLERLPEEVGEYTFIGYLAVVEPYVVDETGEIVDVVKPGDSFVTGMKNSLTPPTPLP